MDITCGLRSLEVSDFCWLVAVFGLILLGPLQTFTSAYFNPSLLIMDQKKKPTTNEHLEDDDDVLPHERRMQPVLRVLISTETHLLPGDSWHQRCFYLLDTVCQLHWKRQFTPGEDRWDLYGGEFGYDNRPCYFLLDHGHTTDDSKVPFLWYRWDGDMLQPVFDPLPPKIQTKLKKLPFTRPKPKGSPSRPPEDPPRRREDIRSKIRCKITIPARDYQFMNDHPDTLAWPRTHLESQFQPQVEEISARIQAGHITEEHCKPKRV